MARPSNNSDWPYRWDLLLRYRLIEIIALWEGRLTTNALIKAFGIGRQQASKDINSYIREISSDNLEYDKQLKGYKPTEQYKPVLTQGTVDEYLHMLNTRRDLVSHFTFLDIQQANTEIVSPLIRSVKAEFIRPIIKACREQKRLEIQYASLSSADAEYRVITPHTLVYSGYRWHVRAFCEKNKQYRDFVLSRIKDIPDPVLPSDNGIQEDIAWNTIIELIIVPDPRLKPFQIQVIANDYGMKSSATQNKTLLIKTRAALADYYLQFLRIDNEISFADPLKQQLVIENRDEIQQWLIQA
ncbi:MAG: WYL domain-containing protein [Pseudomonadota bacterium]